MADHVQTFSCRTGTITISVEELPFENRLPISESLSNQNGDQADAGELSPSDAVNRPALMTKILGREVNVMAMLTGIYDPPPQLEGLGTSTVAERESCPAIVFWRWCRKCNGMVTPFIPLEKYIYKYSFARFLEIMFLEEQSSDATMSKLLPAADGACSHSSTKSHVLFFNVGDWVARFDFTAKIPLRLEFKNQRTRRGFSFDESAVKSEEDQLAVKLVVTKRLLDMKQLLDSLIKLFTEKVQGIKQAVEAFEKCDDGLQAQIVLEVVCLKKLIQCDQLVFLHRIEKLEANAANNLAECDIAQRSLYLLACRWIDRMLKLRKLIKKNLSKEATAAMASSSFTLAGFSFGTPTVLSPIASPRNREDGEYASLAPSAISRDSSDFHWDGKERMKRGSSDALSINGSDISPESSIVSSAASSFTSFESGRKTPSSHSYDRPSGRNGDQKDVSAVCCWLCMDLSEILCVSCLACVSVCDG